MIYYLIVVLVKLARRAGLADPAVRTCRTRADL
jgi:hypothetical protein